MARRLTLPKTNDYIFGNGNLNAFRWKYDRQKHALANQATKPQIKRDKISFAKTFQSYKRVRNDKKHTSR